MIAPPYISEYISNDRDVVDVFIPNVRVYSDNEINEHEHLLISINTDVRLVVQKETNSFIGVVFRRQAGTFTDLCKKLLL